MIIDTCIFDFTGQKNLGRAYNEAMAAAPEGSHVILRDGDTCWLTPDYGVHIAEYIRLHPNVVLTCWTNRINERAEQQYPNCRTITNFETHLQISEQQKAMLYKVTKVEGFVSGFCLIVPKSVWNETKFPEKQMYEDRGPYNLLGCDNYWTNEIRKKSVQILRMDGIYLWHTYRLLTGDQDKSHLM